MIYIADQKFETLKAAFDWCVENGSANDWDVLGMAYFNRGYHMNALHCFKKSDEIQRQKMWQLIGEINSLLTPAAA
jgi:hypothetical protein